MTARTHIPEHRRGIFAIVVAALLWSSGGLLIKLIPLEALQISGIRSIFAAATFFAIYRKECFHFNPLILLSGICYAGILILFVLATKMTTAANAIFLQYTAPIYVLLLEPLLLKTKLRRINVLTIIITFMGMGLFFVGKISAGNMLGNILALLSGVAFAGFLLSMRKTHDDHQEAAIFWGNIIVLLFCSTHIAGIRTLTLSTIEMIAFLGIVQIGIAYALFSYGLKKAEAIEASLISIIEPVLNPIWVFIGYGEQPTPFAVLGGIVILITISIRSYIIERGQAG
jgi:drug/metabolite transporter (DMT)-like permease